MLIDASHSEETRVAILDESGDLQDYEFKSSTKETVKGNIYLAKVARVEPSLQAAFIDYGGNRHGFLAFSEIHPDYFRIPVSDRDSLEEEAIAETEPTETEETGDSLPDSETLPAKTEDETSLTENASEQEEEDIFQMPVSTIGGELPPSDEEDEESTAPRTPPLHRRYKIQEVIHKNQILLVQVSKEERGGKGAALTTFLSLAGRYCVLMPNSPRSGGVSRKINNPADRKRLRDALDSFKVPDGMGLIVRTAGKDRTKAELRRDAQYLMRLWDKIRDTTMQSAAPNLINREDNIIKRAIRDLYTKEISDIFVEGEEGYKVAKDFMKTLMPSHSKRVQRFKMETQPLFHHFGVESQIDAMHDPEVRLPSGGSIVIHPTEALVSIDINSGKATKERHIEETATKTNLEAAKEIARQVKLRDLAGLIVIDFIDMDEPRHISSVEKKVRDSFRDDRARIQLGRISPFGLLEMSRQRLAPSLLERSTRPCQHCHSTGFVRSTESFSLHVLRLLEEEGHKKRSKKIQVQAPTETIFYLMNHKRQDLADIENRHGLKIIFEPETSTVQSCVLTQLESTAPENKVSFEETSKQKEEPKQNQKKGQPRRKKTAHPSQKKRDNDFQKEPKKQEKSKDSAEKGTSSLKDQKSTHQESETGNNRDQQSPQNPSNEGISNPENDKNEGQTRKRRPRRRSGRRPRRPQTDDQKETAQQGQDDGDGKGNASQEKAEDVNAPNATTVKNTTKGNSNKKKATEDDKDKTKGNWWRRLLD